MYKMPDMENNLRRIGNHYVDQAGNIVATATELEDGADEVAQMHRELYVRLVTAGNGMSCREAYTAATEAVEYYITQASRAGAE